jgi:GNAT superfamily N-acetyltransferase
LLIGMILREATAGDAEVLARLRVEFLRETRPGQAMDRDRVLPAARAYFAAAIASGAFRGWVVEVEGQVIATGGYIPFWRPPSGQILDDRRGYVLNMYTLPAYRHRGYATLLLGEIIRAARAEDITRLWLSATEAGRPIYQRLGFTPLVHKLPEMELVVKQT